MGKLQDYQRLVDPDGKNATKLNDIVTKALNQIGAMTTADGVNDYITKAKGDMDKVVNPPKDDSNDDDDDDEDTVPVNADHFLMVGGTWVTPVANAGQEVSIVLPVVNMGKTNVTNAVVTPVLSTDTATWPFEITQSSYSQNIADLPALTPEVRHGPETGTYLEPENQKRCGKWLSEDFFQCAVFCI